MNVYGSDPVPEFVRQAEADEVRKRRKKAGLDVTGFEPTSADLDGVGLALSGGGLRSAAFNLGLLQALDEEGVLRHVDYLSTVSGGGYAGALVSAIAAARKGPAPGTPARDSTSAPAEAASETSAGNLSPALGEHTPGDAAQIGSPDELRLLPELEREGVGARPLLVRRLIRGGMYLVSLPHLLQSYMAGLVCVVVFAISGTLALTSSLALVFRMLDQRPVLRWMYALGFQNDVERAFVPAGLAFLVWIGLTSCAYACEFASGIRRGRLVHRIALFLCAVTGLIAVAGLLGTGDINLPDLNLGQKAELVQVQNLLIVLLPFLLLVGLLPYLRPKELIRSATHPRRPYERWVFKIASYALLGGVPLFLLGWLGRENISGFNESRSEYGSLSAEHIAFTQWPAFLRTIRAEASWSRGEPNEPGTPSEYFLSRSINEDRDLDRLSKAVLEDYEAFSKVTNEKWWWWCATYCFNGLWNRGQADLVPQPWAAYRAMRKLDHDRDAFVARLNSEYLDKPDFGRRYFPDFVTSNDTDRRKAWRQAELCGAAVRAPSGEGSFLSQKAQQDLRLANWKLLQLHFGTEIVHPADKVFAYVVTKFGGADQAWRLRFFLISLLFFLGSGYIVNLNRSSMHGFYRDRLDRAWICRPMQGPEGTALPEHSSLPLAELRSTDFGLPYLLINCTLNFFDDKYAQRLLGIDIASGERSGPASASFLFSKHYCGSTALGFAGTGEYTKGKYDLANAMAVSGAAVSPALSGNWLVVFLLFLSNFRLGQWLDNPCRDKPRWFWLTGRWRFGPAPLPVILDQLFSRAKDREFCFLTDGGHHENLGITPLLERRCRVILVSDAGADPEDKFTEWLKVVHRCRIDHGIRFDRSWRKYADDCEPSVPLQGIAADPQTRLSREHYVITRILYPAVAKAEPMEGYLIYMRASFTGDEDCELTQYRRSNRDFPHDPVIDQFYDEYKFEAYRRLGHHIGMNACRDLFAEVNVVPTDPALSRWKPPMLIGGALQRRLAAVADARRPDDVVSQVAVLIDHHSLDPSSSERLFEILVERLQSSTGDQGPELLEKACKLAMTGLNEAIRGGCIPPGEVERILRHPRESLTALARNSSVDEQLRSHASEALRWLEAASEEHRSEPSREDSSVNADLGVREEVGNLLVTKLAN